MKNLRLIIIIVLQVIFIAIAFFWTRGCALEKKHDTGGGGDQSLVCKEKDIREASCPKGQSGRRFETCKDSAWVETFSDCKATTPGDPACSKVAFDKVIEPIIETNCKGCHSTFTDYATAKTKIDKMISLITNTDPAQRMPKGKDPLAKEDTDKFSAWKADGLLLTCPDPGEKINPTHLDLNYQESAAFLDSKTIPLGAQKDTRWLTITHKSNEGEKKAVLKTFESSIQKAINSISRGRTLVLAKAVDEFQTVFRINLADFKLTQRDWNLIEDTDPLNLVSNTNLGLILRGMTGTRKPLINGDAFIASAMTAKTYYDIRNISNNVDTYLASRGVNQINQIRDFEALFVGITKGTISLNKNRQILRLNSNFGPIWRTNDTDSKIVSDNRNLSKFPLLLSFGNRNFKSDASELIATTQNGLHEYSLFNGQGQRLNEASLSIVAHNVNPPADPTVRTANTCFRCHFGGIIPRTDEIKAIVDRTALLFDLRDVDLVDQLYRDPAASYASDNGDYAVALSKLGILATDVDPITVSQDSLNERPLGLKEIAALLSLTQDEFRNGLNRSAEGIAQIGQVLTGGSVNIDELKRILPILIRDLRIGQEPIR